MHTLHVGSLLCAKNRTPNSLIPNSNFTNTRYAKTGVKTLHVIQIVHTLFYSRKILENRRKSCEDRTIVIGVNKSYKLRLNRKCWHLCTYPPCWLLKARIQKHRGKPLLFHDKCPGFFYVHYTTHGTYCFTSHPKDEAIMVKCLAQGHKHRDRLGQDSNSHSGNTRTWVQCTRPLGHNAPILTFIWKLHSCVSW